MARQVSAEVFRQIKSEGLITDLQMRIYETLFYLGPLSAAEAAEKAKAFGSKAKLNSISPRMAEMKALGVIAEAGERPCKITGRTVIIWDVTDRLPGKIERKETSKEKIKKLEQINEELTDRVNFLEQLLSKKER